MGILKAVWRVIVDLWYLAWFLYVLHWALSTLYWAYRTIIRGDDPRFVTRAIFGSNWRFRPNQGTDWVAVIAKRFGKS